MERVTARTPTARPLLTCWPSSTQTWEGLQPWNCKTVAVGWTAPLGLCSPPAAAMANDTAFQHTQPAFHSNESRGENIGHAVHLHLLEPSQKLGC